MALFDRMHEYLFGQLDFLQERPDVEDSRECSEGENHFKFDHLDSEPVDFVFKFEHFLQTLIFIHPH